MLRLTLILVCFFLLLIWSVGCKKDIGIPQSRQINFKTPQQVTINGYSDDIMEPFLSRDGNTLFFNNSNHPSVNTNIHFAIRVNKLTFDYGGELKGVNSESLDGVATVDGEGNFYFVSTRNYFETLTSVFQGTLLSDSVSGIASVPQLSKNIAGWLNFDVEVSSDGNSIFFADGRYNENGGPYEADLYLASKVNGSFERAIDQSILSYINTASLEYAACISASMLEFYFTRVPVPLTASSVTQIYVATRSSLSEPFGFPYKIGAISGFVEAPTISSNDSCLYYHKKENDKFVLYIIEKE